MSKEPLQPQDKYVLRMPDGMRDRIKQSAERNGRSMNAEIVQALEQYFPPEPSMDEVVESINDAIRRALSPGRRYRADLVNGLEMLKERLEAGLEFDPGTPRVLSVPEAQEAEAYRKRRQSAENLMYFAPPGGVTIEGLRKALENGLLAFVDDDRLLKAQREFQFGRDRGGITALGLLHVPFASESEAAKLLRRAVDVVLKLRLDPPEGDWRKIDLDVE